MATLVAYFSAEGRTAKVARALSKLAIYRLIVDIYKFPK